MVASVPPDREQAARRRDGADDVEELQDFCRRCGEERLFHHQQADFSEVEERAVSPNVTRALSGESVWACEVCGWWRRDPMAEEGYPMAFANVSAVRNDELTEQAAGSQGVSEDLDLRADTGGEGLLRDPSTADDALHEVPSQLAAPGELPPDADDPEVREATLREAGEVERGERDLRLEQGPRRDLPPPERVPAKDPTAERERERRR